MRPITKYLSKPMLPLGNHPVIRYAIDEARNAGCDPVVVIRSAGDEQLLQYVEDSEFESVRVVEQEKPRGLAHAALVGYNALDRKGPCALVIPDNVVLDGNAIRSLLEAPTGDHLVLGTMEVSRKRADDFGNSGAYEAEPTDDGLERITALQAKGEGSFRSAVESWPARRTVARSVLPPEFFERAENREPDPGTGEIDDVPIYRAMIELSVAYGVPVDGVLYDMGTPKRYLKLNKILHEHHERSIPDPVDEGYS